MPLRDTGQGWLGEGWEKVGTWGPDARPISLKGWDGQDAPGKGQGGPGMGIICQGMGEGEGHKHLI